MVPKILQTYRIESAASKSSSDSDSINVKKLTNEIEVQTEWSWLTDMRLMEKVKRGKLFLSYFNSRFIWIICNSSRVING